VQPAVALLLLLAGQFTWPETRQERRGGSAVTYTRNLNGQEVPIQRTDEVVLTKTGSLEITERTTVSYDPNGTPGQPVIERREVRREGDTERTTRTLTRRDPNGNAYVAEIAESVTTTSGPDVTTKTEIQRPTTGGRLELTQTQEIRRSQPSAELSTQTTTTSERNVNRRFVETRRDVVETRREPGGDTVVTETHYAIRGNSGLVLVKREVRRIRGDHAVVDVYEPNAPGRIATGEPQLVQQQSVDRSTSGGQTVETTTVRTAGADGRLGPPRPADRRVCTGDCP
jgi:hypothetical protein